MSEQLRQELPENGVHAVENGEHAAEDVLRPDTPTWRDREEIERRAKERRADTWERKFARRREVAREMREKGAVPAAIAERLGISLESTRIILNELGLKVPRYLDWTEYDDEIPEL